MYTPETSYMKRTSVHIKNIWIKQLHSQKVWNFTMAFRVQKLFRTFKKWAPGEMVPKWIPATSSWTLLIQSPMGHENLAILTGWPYWWGRIKFHDWSKLSDVLTEVTDINITIVLLNHCSYINIQNTDGILKKLQLQSVHTIFSLKRWTSPSPGQSHYTNYW